MSLAARDDTIAAIATAVAAGAGSVAIVRVSGPQAEAIGRQLFSQLASRAGRAIGCSTATSTIQPTAM